MSKTPHLSLRGTVWQYRRKVPLDLLAHYSPKREFTKSLRTSDYREAVRLSNIEDVKLDQEFAEARKRLSPVPVVEISDEEIERLVILQRHRALSVQDRLQMDGLGGTNFASVDADRISPPSLAILIKRLSG